MGFHTEGGLSVSPDAPSVGFLSPSQGPGWSIDSFLASPAHLSIKSQARQSTRQPFGGDRPRSIRGGRLPCA
jgi:hypothetical protein